MAAPDHTTLVGAFARQVLTNQALTADQKLATGWFGILAGEASGGSGWNPREACTIAEATGAALSSWYWIGPALAAAALASSAETHALAQAIIDGKQTATYCFFNSPPHRLVEGGESHARWILGGPTSTVVAASPDDTTILVLNEGSDLTWVGSTTVVDTTREVHQLRFSRPTASLSTSDAAWLNATAVLLACADALGALTNVAALVKDHLLGRHAFGVPLATFQVLQHRLVELDLLIRTARAMIARTGTMLADRSASALTLVDATHVYLVPRLTAALQDCIQLLGAVGFTWEFPIHHALRRSQITFANVRPVEMSKRQLSVARGWGMSS